MRIIQKLIIDKELTNNINVIVRNETGLYSPSNTSGYGGNNGNPVNKLEKIIFELVNMYTNNKYTQVQSNDQNNPDEYYNPSIERIVNKENVTISSSNFDLTSFPDGLYKLYMNTQIVDSYGGDGFVGVDTVVNTSSASYIFNNFNAIRVGTEIYLIQGLVDTTLVLDRPIVTAFSSFKPVLRTSSDFILSQSLTDCINNKIAKLAENCNCSTDSNSINQLSEINIYYWGMLRCIESNDIDQAYSYFQLLKELCGNFNCGCNG